MSDENTNVADATVETSSEDSIESGIEEIVESNESDSVMSEESSNEVQATNEQELEQEIQEAIEDGATEEEIKDMIRQYTIKVDGKEYVKELDLNDEEAVKRELQLSMKGRQSMQELQELKKLYSQEIDRLRLDPFSVLKELDPNFDPLEVSAKYIEDLMKEQELSPEEKAERQLQKEYEEIKAERDRLKKEAEERAQAIEMEKIAIDIENDIMSALDSDPDLIADRETVALVAQELIWAEERGLNVTAKEVLPAVKEQLRKQFELASKRFKSTAALKQYMGQELQDKLREERIQQAKKVTSVNSIKNVSKTEASKEPERPKIKLSDLLR